MCGWASSDVATAYTDVNGNYSIKFNYKLKEKEEYAISIQENNYYSETLTEDETNPIPGKANIIDINAWKPIVVRLHLNITNNIGDPLFVACEDAKTDKIYYNTENVYEKNVSKTYDIYTKPGTDMNIVFRYYTGPNSALVLHRKAILYHTTLEEINNLSFDVDCSTF